MAVSVEHRCIKNLGGQKVIMVSHQLGLYRTAGNHWVIVAPVNENGSGDLRIIVNARELTIAMSAIEAYEEMELLNGRKLENPA